MSVCVCVKFWVFTRVKSKLNYELYMHKKSKNKVLAYFTLKMKYAVITDSNFTKLYIYKVKKLKIIYFVMLF